MQSKDTTTNSSELDRGISAKYNGRKRKNDRTKLEPLNTPSSNNDLIPSTCLILDAQTDDEDKSKSSDARKVARRYDAQKPYNNGAPALYNNAEQKGELHEDELSSTDGLDEVNSSDRRDEEAGSSSGKTKSSNRMCLVCGDRASGFNFNILSCESCKAFFRRNALKQSVGSCLFSGDCKIEVHTRRFCAVCRLGKCLRMGMKRSMILDDDAKEKRRNKVMENRERRARVRNDKQSSNANSAKGSCTSNSIRSEVDNAQASHEEHSDEVSQNLTQQLGNGNAINSGSTNAGALQAVAQYPPFVSAISIPIHVPVSALTNLPISVNLAGQGLSTIPLSNQALNSVTLTGQTLPPKSGIVTLPLQPDTGHQLAMSAQTNTTASFPSGLSVSDLIGVGLGVSPPAQNSIGLPLCDLPSITNALSPSLSLSSLNVPYNNVTMEIAGQGQFQLSQAGDHAGPGPGPDLTGFQKSNNEVNAKLFDEQRATSGAFDSDPAPLPMTVASLDSRSTFVFVAQPTGNEQPDVVASSNAGDMNSSLEAGPAVRAPASLQVSGLNLTEAAGMHTTPASLSRLQNACVDADELRRRMNRRVLTYEEWKFVSYLCAFYEEAFISDQHSDEIPHPNTTLNALVNVAGFMVRKLIRFAKRIVDFQTLRQDSQIALLKGGVVNTVYLRSAFHYDAATDSWCTPHGRIRADILKQALRGSAGSNGAGMFAPTNERSFCDSNTVYEEHCQFARSLKPLLDNDLNIVTLLQVITLFSPDRPSILQTYLPKSALLCPFTMQQAPTGPGCATQKGSNSAGSSNPAFSSNQSPQTASSRLSAVVQPNLTLNVTPDNRSELDEAIFTTTGEQSRIANIQDKFVVLLKHYLEAKYSFSHSRTLFVRIMQKLDELNELTELHGRVLLFADPSKIEPLMLEVLDLLASR